MLKPGISNVSDKQLLIRALEFWILEPGVSLDAYKHWHCIQSTSRDGSLLAGLSRPSTLFQQEEQEEVEEEERDEEAVWTVPTTQMCCSGPFRTCSAPHQPLELLSWSPHWRCQVPLEV